MRALILAVGLMSLPVFAQESINFRNDREGKSIYATGAVLRNLENVTREISGPEILSNYRAVLQGVNVSRVCAYDVNSQLKRRFVRLSPRFNDYISTLHYLRSQNEIDDVALSILMKAEEVTTAVIEVKSPQDLRAPTDRVKNAAILSILSEFEAKYAARDCFDDAYRKMWADIVRSDSGLRTAQLEALLVMARDRRKITSATYQKLERARAQELEASTLSLKSYHQKVRSIRLQYPLRDASEKSNYITQKVDNMKVSRRQKLMENYTDIQIMLMGNVVKRLRSRLEASRIDINIFDREGNPSETISLDPMERFRFAIKLLRKEIATLSLNTYFNGRSPDYLDVMAASYEIGLIPASEVDELAALEEVWNPRKTFWDKASTWITMFSSVATIAIPPPYGFIPALVLVVIEATTGRDANAEDNGVLF